MPYFLRYNTASQEVPLGYFVDSSDGNTEETGLSIANTNIKLHKAGATSLANKNSGGATHMANGIYYVVLDATDTNTKGPMVIFVHVSGALAVRLECFVLDPVVYDSMIGSDLLQADVQQISGSAVSTSTAQLGVNTVNIGGSAAAGVITGAVLSDSTKIGGANLNTLASHDPGETIMGATDLGTGSGLTSLASASELAKVPKSDGSTSWNSTALGDMADAIWDEATSGHTTSGTFGKLFNLFRKLFWNKSVDGGTSVTYYDDDNSTPLGSASWDDSTGTRGKNNVTW